MHAQEDRRKQHLFTTAVYFVVRNGTIYEVCVWAKNKHAGGDWHGKRRVVYTNQESTALAWL